MAAKQYTARSNKSSFMKMAYKGILASLLGALVVACSGCGGGGGGSPAETAAAPKAPISVTIDMEGDSLIWGYTGMIDGVSTQSPNNPPKVVQAILQGTFGPTVTTQNNAVPGAAVANSLTGDGFPGTLPVRLAANNAQIVLSDYATNDSVLVSVDTYKAQMIQWVEDVKSAGKIPVLEEPNPSCAPKHASLGQFRDAMVSVAAQENIMLIQQYDYIMSLPNWQSMLLDCTHPNDALYAIKAQREAQQLAPLVQKLMQ